MKNNLPVSLHKRVSIGTAKTPVLRGESDERSYLRGDRVYVATFIKRADVTDKEVFLEVIHELEQNALLFADASFEDAFISALASETRIASIAKYPAEWKGLIATIQYRSVENDRILIFNDLSPVDNGSGAYKASVIGLEITPITQISLGIDPYHRGTYLRNLTFESKNI